MVKCELCCKAEAVRDGLCAVCFKEIDVAWEYVEAVKKRTEMAILGKGVIDAAIREVDHTLLGYAVFKQQMKDIGKPIPEGKKFDGGSWEYGNLIRAVEAYENRKRGLIAPTDGEHGSQ